ncbi:MAG: RNA polymerase sigma factor [Planctomycetes bacterium]|nr:RNA polymerase sigma factor [Planctomycetota bacterium]
MTLQEIYDRYADDLYAYACVLCRSEDEAADALQDCFVRLALRPLRLDLSDLRGYLFVSLRNAAAGRRRRWAVWRARDKRGGVPALSPVDGDAGVAPDEAMRIERGLAALPPEQREVVFLKVWQGISFDAIGRLLGIPMNTAASRYRYALEALRGILGRDGP